MIRRIVVQAQAVAVMMQERRKVILTETGGPMVGYVEKDEVIVTGAAGPGPRAKLTPFSVVVDGVFAQKFCDDALRQSGGKVDYVGDWHCHPAFSVDPSADDLRAMKTMAEFEHCPTAEPVSLIWSKWR